MVLFHQKAELFIAQDVKWFSKTPLCVEQEFHIK